MAEDDVVFFCEDDYLHMSSLMEHVEDLWLRKEEIIASRIKNLNWLSGKLSKRDLFLIPADDPDRYKEDQIKMSFVFLGKNRHWRQVTNTTFTFMTQVRTFKKYKNIFLKTTQGANDGYWSKSVYTPFVYADFLFQNRALCLAPIPSLSAHFHTSSLPPCIDWEAELKKYL
jgi:hypothetical protein